MSEQETPIAQMYYELRRREVGSLLALTETLRKLEKTFYTQARAASYQKKPYYSTPDLADHDWVAYSTSRRVGSDLEGGRAVVSDSVPAWDIVREHGHGWRQLERQPKAGILFP